MGEFGRSAGGELPHDEASTREHFDQVGDAVRHEREADRVPKDRRSEPPWWKLWVRRDSR